MNKKLKILFVEDVQSDVELILLELKKSKINFSEIVVDEKEEYLNHLQNSAPDIIISDYSLPQFDGMKALLLRNEKAPLTPFIIVTGSVNEEVAVDCMKAGADDYILKDNLVRLGPAVLNSINKINLLKEKKTAEDELRKSEHRLEVAQTIAHVGNWELNLSSRTIWCSDEALRIYGFDPDTHEVPLEQVLKGVLPVYKPILEESLDRLLKYNETFEAEYKFKQVSTGMIRSIILKAELIVAGDSEQVKVVGVVQDTTDRRKAEQALIESEEKFRIIIESMGEGIGISDTEENFVFVNPAAERIFGVGPGELIGTSILRFMSPENVQLVKKQTIERRKDLISSYEIEIILKGGEKKQIILTGTPKFDSEGRFVGTIGIFRDITERKRAEEELHQSYLFNDSLLKTIPFGMNIVDEGGTVLFQSDSFARLFGSEAIGKKCWDLYRDDKTQCENCPLIDGIVIGETESYESHNVLGNRIFDISHTGMMYKGKKAMLEIFQDITDRKENEEELIRAKEKAEESGKLKTAFLHNISHEIRTPMNAIVGFSTLLAEPDVDEITRKSYIEMIMKGSDHLLAIISDIIDISNIEANIVKISNNGINLNNLIKSLHSQFLPRAIEKNITLLKETALPDSDAIIISDNTKLVQVISNLLNNAIKFTQQGEIKLGYLVKEKFIEFFVSDTGLGIPEEYHERIFDRFFQVENSVSKLYEGTGLGLAICKAYVERMGGEMRLFSTPGIGSTFYFTIPFERPVDKTVPVSVQKTGTGFVFAKKRKILVAEDIDSNFKLIGYFLSGANTEIIRAVNGKEAVDKCLADKSIDLILMDIKMPVMDGYTAVKLIRKTRPDLPIIAQTAYADDKGKAIECGCSGFISKPFDKKSLLKVMSEFI